MQVALMTDRMHHVTPALVLVSSTLLYDIHRDKRFAGLPLQQRGDLEEINCAPPATIMRDIALQCVSVTYSAVKTNAVHRRLLLYIQTLDILSSATHYFSTEESERVRFQVRSNPRSLPGINIRLV